MECPKCRLVNPQEALRCDCGYDFVAKAMKESYVEADLLSRVPNMEEFVRELGERDIRVGAVWAAGGIAVSLGTYAYADELGGTYFLTYGAVLYGLVRLARGIDRVRSGVQRPLWGKPTLHRHDDD